MASPARALIRARCTSGLGGGDGSHEPLDFMAEGDGMGGNEICTAFHAPLLVHWSRLISYLLSPILFSRPIVGMLRVFFT